MADNPPLFENPDSGPPKGFGKPSLPKDYDSLSPDRIWGYWIFRETGGCEE
jgi:hypothetical protein